MCSKHLSWMYVVIIESWLAANLLSVDWKLSRTKVTCGFIILLIYLLKVVKNLSEQWICCLKPYVYFMILFNYNFHKIYIVFNLVRLILQKHLTRPTPKLNSRQRTLPRLMTMKETNSTLHLNQKQTLQVCCHYSWLNLSCFIKM